MLPEHSRRYLLHGLAATPVVVDRLMQEATAADFDHRPDPERFTLREVLAHLADWDPIWLERLTRIRTEDRPDLPSIDESQRCLDGDYAHADVAERQAAFREARGRLLVSLRALPPDDWDRWGQHSEWGSMSVSQLATLILGHDGYHLRQIAEWLSYGDTRVGK
jgi:uncharacterized damage-inducible protein DinB